MIFILRWLFLVLVNGVIDLVDEVTGILAIDVLLIETLVWLIETLILLFQLNVLLLVSRRLFVNVVDGFAVLLLEEEGVFL